MAVEAGTTEEWEKAACEVVVMLVEVTMEVECEDDKRGW